MPVRFGPCVRALLRFELTRPAGKAGARIGCYSGGESRSVILARPVLAIPADCEYKNVRNCAVQAETVSRIANGYAHGAR